MVSRLWKRISGDAALAIAEAAQLSLVLCDFQLDGLAVAIP